MDGNRFGDGATPRTRGACDVCRDDMQDYLDGTLAKPRSLEVFLHLRECAACRQEHDRSRLVFGLLDRLPAHEVPADFDAAILAAVPYASYRAMAHLRRERVPVFLEEQFLPAVIRSRATRFGGVAVSAVAAGSFAFVTAEPLLAAVAAIGLVPELLVRLQGLGRRLLALGRAEG